MRIRRSFTATFMDMFKPDLSGKIALVTGASRGVGRGVAYGLGESGATVYVTGRNRGDLEMTAKEVTRLGGRGVHRVCDHREDEQVERVFDLIRERHGKLDILVNAVWGGYDRMIDNGEWTCERPFWEQSPWRWDAMFQGGVRANYVAGYFAAPLMIGQKRGLIVNLSFWAAQKYSRNVPYGVSKAATDRLTADMALELREHNVAVVSLYPGWVRTELAQEVVTHLGATEVFEKESESPQFVGRCVSALAVDKDIMSRTGQVAVTGKLGLVYGFCDIDGRQPAPTTLEKH